MQAYLYVGIRDHFFTLRLAYEKIVHFGPGDSRVLWQHEHIQNLSQCAEEALVKAKAFAGRSGYALGSSEQRIHDAGDLLEIKRRSAEQVAAAKRAEQAEREDAAAKREQEARDRIAGMVREARSTGRFPEVMGKVSGAHICAEVGYVDWMLRNRNGFERGSLHRSIANLLASRYSHMLLPQAAPNGHIGTVNKRGAFSVVVTRRFSFEGFYGTTHIVTMVTDCGHCLVSKGSFYADAGERLSITAFVKAHDEYKGQDQTVINRVKVAA